MQINYALELIDKKHPMRDTPMSKVWPFLDLCRCGRKEKKNFKIALKKTIRNELGIPVPKGDKNISSNPYLLLGFGFNAYFKI
jgi:hypothetical protein